MYSLLNIHFAARNSNVFCKSRKKKTSVNILNLLSKSWQINKLNAIQRRYNETQCEEDPDHDKQ